ncbi:Asr1405/Asl0597 family protein [Oscillatoria sp. CS-180]|uniref:Asr1405/Asl0597 family protein n=1 Tax=Oscillatoria sp. CS-180 TaxID=3021720 RepID=UPI003FA7E90D
MDTLETDLPSQTITLELDPIERWNAFARLKELSITCHCSCGQPLQVVVESPTAALQVWSIVRRLTLSRDRTVELLENCWRHVTDR